MKLKKREKARESHGKNMEGIPTKAFFKGFKALFRRQDPNEKSIKLAYAY